MYVYMYTTNKVALLSKHIYQVFNKKTIFENISAFSLLLVSVQNSYHNFFYNRIITYL